MKRLFLAALLNTGFWLLSTTVHAQPAVTIANSGTGWAAPWYIGGRSVLLSELSCTDQPVGGTNLVVGTGFTAELWAGLAGGQLAPVTRTVFFPSGPLAGLVVPPAATSVPFAAAGQSIEYQLRVWDNRNGTIPVWPQVDFYGYGGKSDVYISPPLPNGTTTLEFRDSYSLARNHFAFRCPVISVGVAGMSPYLFQRSVYKGDNVTLTVECPNPAATVQWSRYGTNLPDATNLTLNVTGIDSGSAGLYTAVVTGLTGSRIATMTNTATVTLFPPPRIVLPRIHPLNGFNARIDGVIARGVQIDVSPDLHSWTSWRTQYIGACSSQDWFFTNSFPLLSGSRFYRVRVLP